MSEHLRQQESVFLVEDGHRRSIVPVQTKSIENKLIGTYTYRERERERRERRERERKEREEREEEGESLPPDQSL